MAGLDILKQPRVMGAFIAAPVLTTSLIALPLGSLELWAYFIGWNLTFAALLGAPAYVLLCKSDRPRLSRIVLACAVLSAVFWALGQAVTFHSRFEKIRADPTTDAFTSAIVSAIYTIPATAFGAAGGAIFWMLAFYKPPARSGGGADGA